MKNKKVLCLVLGALFAALICVFTMIFTIPLPGRGYINLGDCIVILAGCILGPVYGTIAGGLGSAMADIFLGYTVYAPGTFIIKAVMALASFLVFSGVRRYKTTSYAPAVILASVAGEVIMLGGYFVYEIPMFGLKTALASLAGNGLQAMGAGIISSAILGVIIRNRYIRNILTQSGIGKIS